VCTYMYIYIHTYIYIYIYISAQSARHRMPEEKKTRETREG